MAGLIREGQVSDSVCDEACINAAQSDFLDSFFASIDRSFEDLNGGLHLYGLNVAEAYRNGHAVLRLLCPDNIELLAAAFPNLPDNVSALDLLKRYGNDRSVNETGVFVDYVQIMEGAEYRPFPSVVWLQRRQPEPDGLGNFLAFGFERSFESIDVLSVREIRAFRAVGQQYGTLANCLIESRSKVVDGVGSRKPNIRRQWLRKPKFKFDETCLDVFSQWGSLKSAILHEGANQGGMFFDVTFGPFNF